VTELFGEGEIDLEALALGNYGIDPAPAFDRADPDAHAGPAVTSAPPPPLVRLLVDEIMAACAEQRTEIVLDTRALDGILPPLTPPATCELFLAPRAQSGGWLLGLHAPAGSTWGRFAAALGAPLLDALAKLNEVEVAARPDQLRLDVAYAPSEAAADLCTAPHVRPQMLALSTWPASEDEDEDEDEDNGDGKTDHGEGIAAEAITPADLMLVSSPALDEPTLTFAGLAAVPSPLTRVRSTTAPPGIFRMLAGASFHRQHGPWAVSLGALADLAFVPRIWIDAFVVSPASWRLPERLDARRLRAWRRSKKVGLPALPRFVQVGNQDELLPVDLDGPDALRDLAGHVRVWEIWPPLDEPALDQQGRRLEAVIALVDQPDVAAGAAAVARARALATAGPVPPPQYVPAAEGWRSFKLFGAENRQNDVLLSAVRPAVHAARDAGEIDGWFFVRYADDHGLRPHLRLRVHTGADQRAPLDAFAARLDEALEGARAAGLVALVESGPYHPEVARFGGAEIMAIAWRIFTLDSELACGLLGEGEDVDPVDALVGVFDGLAAGLGFTQVERHEYARGRRDAAEELAAPADEDQRRARDADFRARAPRLRALLSGTPTDEPLPLLLAAYRDAVAEAAQELDVPARQRIAAPLLHLAAVRLTGTSRDLEARAYLLWERTLEGLLRSPPKPPAATAKAPEDTTRLN
jgi:thiopeptide-type bacteriocin biosynthesis protein